MTLQEAIVARHSVRSFTDQKLEGETLAALQNGIAQANRESGLHLQLFLEEAAAFDGMMAHYGNFVNCKNYIAIVGRGGTDELCGYYAEQIVLLAQTLGLNTCWVAMSYSKAKVPCVLEKGEKLQLVLALGYGATQGVPHKSKELSALCRVNGAMPGWFQAGMEAARLAPTAMNQQKFVLTLDGATVQAKALPAFYSKVDLGIVKCHFEIGAGKENFKWAT